MPKVRSGFREPKLVSYGLPGERWVDPDEVIDVPEQYVYSYTLQPEWDAVDAEAEKAHAAGKKAEDAALYAERKRRGELTPEEIEKEAAAAEKAAKKGDA